MKVLAAPFEPPVNSTDIEPSEAARLKNEADEKIGVTPISPLSTDLGPATRHSLSKLAVLIRSQFKNSDDIKEQADEEAEEKIEAERLATPRPRLAGEPIAAPDDVLGSETVLQATFPNVDLVRRRLSAETRKRGLGVYQQQKSNAAIDILTELLKAS